LHIFRLSDSGISITMFVYLDESGDCGFKFRQGSSRFFVVTLLLVEDPIPLHSEVDAIRYSLGFSSRTEFKFSHCADDVKEAFLHRVCRNEFRIRALVIDKVRIAEPQLRNRDTFYTQVVELVLNYDHGSAHGMTIVLDEVVRSRRQQLTTGSRLRKSLNSSAGKFGKVKIVHHASNADNLIQVVDMLSGAIYRRYDRGDERFFRLIGGRIQDLWEWPPIQE
jgi:hypothetical protein